MPPYKVMKYWRHKKNVLLNIKLQKQNLNWIAYTHSVSLSLTILLQYNPSLWCWKKVFPNGNFVLSTVQTERAFQNLWHIRDASNFHSKIKNVFVLQFIFWGFFLYAKGENNDKNFEMEILFFTPNTLLPIPSQSHTIWSS